MDDLFETRRYDFLKTMYSEMWGNVNRHLTIIWQSVSVLGGTLAAFSLVEKNVVNIDVASSIVVIICSWLVANAYITSLWFNRNQAIISNIERQFLRQADLKIIHPYFMSHRRPGSMAEHIQLQWVLGIFLGVGVLLGDFILEVWPYLHHLCSLELRHSVTLPRCDIGHDRSPILSSKVIRRRKKIPRNLPYRTIPSRTESS